MLMKRKLKKNFTKVSENKFITTDNLNNCYSIPTKIRNGSLYDKTDNYVLEGENMNNKKCNEKNNYQIRKLTPRECERLQGFEDDWTRFGKDGEEISDTQRYKCCGNAVTTTVITHIVDEMFDNVE